MNRYENVPEMYQDTLGQILERGHVTSPRGKLTKELIGHSFAIENVTYNTVTQATRKLNPSFMAAEFMWMINGSNDARLIVPYNSQVEKFSDNGLFDGAYGPKLIDQLPYILRTLTADPSSRQAVLTLWRERPGPSKDVPCTVMMQFFIRNQMLDMVTYMRSNDAWLGLPYDVFTFTMIQKTIACLLDVEPGWYHHHVGSLHLYEEYWLKAKKVVAENTLQIPYISMNVLTAPMPPETWSVFNGMSLLAVKNGVTPEDVNSWLDLSGVAAYPEWLDLLQLCAYRFHRDPRLLPAQWQRLLIYWDQHLMKLGEQA